MRIALVASLNLKSWFEQDKKRTDWSAPIGLLSLAAGLEQQGHHVFVHDLNYLLSQGTLDLHADFYGVAMRRILAENPDLVGFSTMCNSYHLALRMAEAVKKNAPPIPIVFGGPQASVVDRETLETFPWVDVILRGEAEMTMPRLVEELETGTKEFRTEGLTWKDAAGIVRRNPDPGLLPDLDLLPMPAYHLVPYGSGDSLAIEAGRGCPFGCTFCSTSTYWGRRFRLKSTDRILKEMRFLKEKYGSTFFSFRHDLFTLDQGRVREFCNRMKAEMADIKWACSARVDCVSEDLLREMGEAGCVAIFYGMETASPRMQKAVRKNLKVERAREIFDASISCGIDPTVSFIAGFPEEKEDDLRQTMRMIQDLMSLPQVSVQLHLLGPERGTSDWEQHRNRLRFDGYYSDISGTASALLEPDWYRQYPGLFSSFHYYESDALSREYLQGIDLFVHGPCSVLRRTVTGLLRGVPSLFDLYTEWRRFALDQGKGGGPLTGQKVDDYLLDFYSFVEQQAARGKTEVDPGVTRDEILAFLLEYYNETPVQWLLPGERTATKDEQACKEA
jgi:radical SAM superfamily enzyme YgiQ (UPF0313 family)